MIQRLFAAFFSASIVLFFILSTLSPIADKNMKDLHEQTQSHNENSPVMLQSQNNSFNEYNPLNYEETKAMWFAYFDYRNILQGKSADEFRFLITQRFTDAKNLGINTLYVHVRANGDAYYKSNIFPWGSRCVGTLGVAPDFDPLEIMVDIAHDLELSFHAWVNPLRLMTYEEMLTLNDECILKQWYNDSSKNGKYIINIDNTFYLNPAYDDVRNLVSDGIDEIIRNYNVDGIHIDDYFYPTTNVSFDSSAFEQSGYANLEKWRYANTNALVSQIYKTIKNYDRRILFGISPAALDSVNKSLYANVDAWCCQNIYCDYIVPQIYFGYTSQTAPFDTLFNLWKEKVKNKNIKLIIGICTYKYASDNGEWSDSSVSMRQIEQALADTETSGVAIYSYSSTFEPSADFELYDSVRTQITSALS